MKNKIFMIFGGAVAAMCPWLARAETFPTDGNMLENKTYESAATYDNMGVYDGTVTAVAEYADILYSGAAGTYLPAASEDVAACPAGYYCPGLSNATYSETNNQGLNSCPDGYTNSNAGAIANTQCYTTCSDTSVIAHATAVAGNDYYGNGVDTCYATECDNGYHPYNSIEMIELDPLIAGADLYATATSSGYISANGSNKQSESAFGLTENNTWAAGFKYGTVYGQASCQPESPESQAIFYCTTGIGDVNSLSSAEFRSQLLLYGIDTERTDAITEVFTEYKAGNKTKEEMNKACHAFLDAGADANFSRTDSGQYCYCQMTDFKPTDGIKASVTSAPWVFLENRRSVDGCASYCASFCVGHLAYNYALARAFRAALYGTLDAKTVGVCAANEISITWDGADAADVAANNAGTCTYDGDIRTPVKAQSVPGKIFKGWKFNK